MSELFNLKTTSIFFVVIFSCVNANSGAFTESAAASTSSSGLASTQTTVAPIANIAITGAANYIGTQIYESGGLATIGLVPEKIKQLSPLAYIKDEKFLPNNPKLTTCKETLDVINLQNFSNENNNINNFITEGCSINSAISSFGDKKMSAIKYLEE
tara:strand:+ start:468 stop:938 length:471 start_codon:yes stop_codon:yes gene_type:complete